LLFGRAEVHRLRFEGKGMESNFTTVFLLHASFPLTPGEYGVYTLLETKRSVLHPVHTQKQALLGANSIMVP
jgi:hypothetical protein